MLRKLLYLYIFINFILINALSVGTKPDFVVYTPNSVLSNINNNMFPLFTGQKSRFATCSGVAWFNNNKYLAAINLWGETLYVYAFDDINKQFKLFQKINNSNGACLAMPENLAISNDEKLLAVSNGKDGSTNIYEINEQKIINPVPIYIIKHKDDFGTHGVRFLGTAGGAAHHLAITTFTSGAIYIYKLYKNNKLSLNLISKMQNKFEPLKPKSLDISRDFKFIAVCYSPNATAGPTKCRSIIAIYSYDCIIGIINTNPVCVINENDMFECDDINFSPDGKYLAVPNQAGDSVHFYDFDKQTGLIKKNLALIKNPDAKLSFPHGLSFSKDGNYLAVSNYGDDKITIYKIN